MGKKVKINFEASEREAVLYWNLKEVSGIPLSEIIRRALKLYAKTNFPTVKGLDKLLLNGKGVFYGKNGRR